MWWSRLPEGQEKKGFHRSIPSWQVAAKQWPGGPNQRCSCHQLPCRNEFQKCAFSNGPRRIASSMLTVEQCALLLSCPLRPPVMLDLVIWVIASAGPDKRTSLAIAGPAKITMPPPSQGGILYSGVAKSLEILSGRFSTVQIGSDRLKVPSIFPPGCRVPQVPSAAERARLSQSPDSRERALPGGSTLLADMITYRRAMLHRAAGALAIPGWRPLVDLLKQAAKSTYCRQSTCRMPCDSCTLPRLLNPSRRQGASRHLATSHRGRIPVVLVNPTFPSPSPVSCAPPLCQYEMGKRGRSIIAWTCMSSLVRGVNHGRGRVEQ